MTLEMLPPMRPSVARSVTSLYGPTCSYSPGLDHHNATERHITSPQTTLPGGIGSMLSASFPHTGRHESESASKLSAMKLSAVGDTQPSGGRRTIRNTPSQHSGTGQRSCHPRKGQAAKLSAVEGTDDRSEDDS